MYPHLYISHLAVCHALPWFVHRLRRPRGLAGGMARQRIAAAVHLAADRGEGQHVEGVLLSVLFPGDLGAKIRAVADLTV